MAYRVFLIDQSSASGFALACPCGWIGNPGYYDFIKLKTEFDCHECLPERPGTNEEDFAEEPGPLEQFDAAIQTVTQQRGEVYGHPAVDFDRVARLKAVVAECADAPVRHALEMICVKVARLIETPSHNDSAIDIAGYARTIAMIWDKREKEK